MEFDLSQELALLSQHSSNLSEYPIEVPEGVDLLDQHEQTTTLNRQYHSSCTRLLIRKLILSQWRVGLVDTLANDSSQVTDQSTFDTIRSLIKRVQSSFLTPSPSCELTNKP